MKKLRGALAGAALLSVLSTTVTPVAAQEVAEPEEELVLSLDGHGWGHGRGMGQFGALGYAIDFGWSSEQILDHFYGDTTAGVQPNSLLTVRIDAANDDPTVVQVDSGSVVLIDDDDEVTHVSDGQAMRLRRPGRIRPRRRPHLCGPLRRSSRRHRRRTASYQYRRWLARGTRRFDF